MLVIYIFAYLKRHIEYLCHLVIFNILCYDYKPRLPQSDPHSMIEFSFRYQKQSDNCFKVLNLVHLN